MKDTEAEYIIDQVNQRWEQTLLPLLNTLKRLEGMIQCGTATTEVIMAAENIKYVLIRAGILPKE